MIGVIVLMRVWHLSRENPTTRRRESWRKDRDENDAKRNVCMVPYFTHFCLQGIFTFHSQIILEGWTDLPTSSVHYPYPLRSIVVEVNFEFHVEDFRDHDAKENRGSLFFLCDCFFICECDSYFCTEKVAAFPSLIAVWAACYRLLSIW